MSKRNNKEYRVIAPPKGASEEDSFACTTIAESEAECEVEDCIYNRLDTQPGDVLIVYKTTDVVDGDVAHVTKKDRDSYVGEIRFTKDGFELDGEKYSKRTFKLVGRVIEIQRKGKRIKPKLKLRPIHELQPRRRRAPSGIARRVLKEINSFNPRFSIQNGVLRITT